MSLTHFKRINRYDLAACTGDSIQTVVSVSEPTLLQPIREDYQSTSGVGEVRIAAKPLEPIPPISPGAISGEPIGAGLRDLFPMGWVNGDLWLPSAGDWQITIRALSEDGSQGTCFCLPYYSIGSPDPFTVYSVMLGRSARRPAYHAELVTEQWNQVMKLEQRLTVSEDISLSCRHGALRYRWGGPPSNPDGIAYDLLLPGEAMHLAPAPLCSLWVRADKPWVPGTKKVEVNLISQLFR